MPLEFGILERTLPLFSAESVLQAKLQGNQQRMSAMQMAMQNRQNDEAILMQQAQQNQQNATQRNIANTQADSQERIASMQAAQQPQLVRALREQSGGGGSGGGSKGPSQYDLMWNQAISSGDLGLAMQIDPIKTAEYQQKLLTGSKTQQDMALNEIEFKRKMQKEDVERQDKLDKQSKEISNTREQTSTLAQTRQALDVELPEFIAAFYGDPNVDLNSDAVPDFSESTLIKSYIPGTDESGLEAKFQRIVTPLIRAESGANIPQEEVEQLRERFMPSITDSDRSVRDKLRALQYIITNQDAFMSGGKVQYSKVDNLMRNIGNETTSADVDAEMRRRASK